MLFTPLYNDRGLVKVMAKSAVGILTIAPGLLEGWEIMHHSWPTSIWFPSMWDALCFTAAMEA